MRRSLAMLSPGAPGRTPEDWIVVLELVAELLADRPPPSALTKPEPLGRR